MNQLIINLIVGSSLLLAFLIFINPNQFNKKGNFWLGCFIFCLFLINIDEFLVLNNILFFKENRILLLSFPLFVVAPIFSFSIIYFINPTKKWRNVNYLHFLFGVLFTIFSYQYIYFQEDKLYVKNDQGSFHEWINIILIFVILPLQALYYIGKSYFYIRKHKKNINLFSSNPKDINLKWLENILYFIAVLGMLFIVDIATHKIDFLNLALLLCIFYIGFYTTKQKEIFPFTKEKTKEIIGFFTDKNSTDSEKKLLLTQEKVSEIKEKISRIMKNDKVFLNPDINLVFLANLLELSTHSLSFVINQGFNENFNQFVNRYRIEEAKKMILNPDMNHLSISGIGYEVGFNSKSVFNTTFKKLENCTPLQYKNQNLLLKISS
jgi:AraC-like DNA-binding protein